MLQFLQTLGKSPKICWGILLLFVGLGFLKDVVYTFEQGGIDFRNRLTGARLLIAGKDPYWYKWKPGDPLRWADPREPIDLPTNRNTVAPTCLALFAPFAPLSHLLARLLWLVLQWAIYVALALLLIQSSSRRMDRDAIVFLVLVVLIGESWREHVERGQIYILFAFLLILSYRLLRWGSINWSGLVLGLLISLRPTLLLVLVPFVLSRYWRFSTFAAVGVVAGIGGSFIIADTNDWTSYFTAMDEICRNYIAGGHNTLPIWANHPTMPDIIEGRDNLSRTVTFNVPETGFARIARVFRAPQGKVVLQITMLAYVGLFTIWIRSIWKNPASHQVTFFVGTVIALTAELFLPIHRGAYTNIVWIVPAGILILELGASSVFGTSLVWLPILGLSIAFGLTPMSRGDILAIGDLCLMAYFACVAVHLIKMFTKSPEASAMANYVA